MPIGVFYPRCHLKVPIKPNFLKNCPREILKPVSESLLHGNFIFGVKNFVKCKKTMLILSKLAFWQMRLSKNLQNTFKHYILCQLTLIFHLQCSNYFITRKVIKISRESGPYWTIYLGYLEKQNCYKVQLQESPN